uniref:Uncharacterized protein n=1 Tax=Nymphaea colorata TaxID=210225 RepID=A0A5K0UVT8_9MAGN
MDSSEVAQNLVSPLMAGDSHRSRVTFMADAWGECGLREKRRRMVGKEEVEKGSASAAWRGRKVGSFCSELILAARKLMSMVMLGFRSFSNKKRPLGGRQIII